MKKNKYKIISLSTAFALLLGIVFVGMPQATRADELDSLYAEQEELQSKIDDVSSQIDELSSEHDKASQEYEWLKKRSKEQQEQVDELQDEQEKTLRVQQSLLINLQEAQKRLANKREQYGERVSSMFEMQSKSWLELLLESESLQGFFSTMRFMNTVTQADEEALDQLMQEELRVNNLIKQTDESMAGLKEHITEVNEELAKIKQDEKYYSQKVAEASWKLGDAHQQMANIQAQNDEIAGKISTEKERIVAEEQAKAEAEAERQRQAEEARRKQEEEANDTSTDSDDITEVDTPNTDSSGSTTPTGHFIWPSNNGYTITSGFGERYMFGRSFHSGIDIGAPGGTPILASDAGTVQIAEWYGGYGNFILIDHGNGYATAYGHMSGYACGVGDHVAQGQTIGYVGSTGDSTGNHIHFEIRINGVPVDPTNYVS